ncbi:hypothetical protein [Clostridium senegalense]|nr:hypothetical protein [Clostridium senegalense]
MKRKNIKGLLSLLIAYTLDFSSTSIGTNAEQDVESIWGIDIKIT